MLEDLFAQTSTDFSNMGVSSFPIISNKVLVCARMKSKFAMCLVMLYHPRQKTFLVAAIVVLRQSLLL